MGKKKIQSKSTQEDETKEKNGDENDIVEIEKSSNLGDNNEENVDNKEAEDALGPLHDASGKSAKTRKQLYEEMKKNKKEMKKGGKDKKSGEKEEKKNTDNSGGSEKRKDGELIVDDNAKEAASLVKEESQFPINVVYCPFCTFPAEMCEFSGMFDKCKTWLMEQLIKEEDKLALESATEKGRKRKILTEKNKLKEILKRMDKNNVEREVLIECHNRKRKKYITTVTGLDVFGVNLKEAVTDFKKSFSTGASISKENDELDRIEIQGNFIQRLFEVLPNKYNVPKESIKEVVKKKTAKNEAGNEEEEDEKDEDKIPSSLSRKGYEPIIKQKEKK